MLPSLAPEIDACMLETAPSMLQMLKRIRHNIKHLCFIHGE